MRYLGNKRKLVERIIEIIKGLDGKSVFDCFGGSGTVGQALVSNGYNVLSSDVLYFCYVLNYAKVCVPRQDLVFSKLNMTLDEVIKYLNNQKERGFVYEHYSPDGDDGTNHVRKYFTSENAEIIDGIRMKIELWNTEDMISVNEYIFLIALLLESVSLYSNIPGTYGAFNTKWDPRALKTFELKESLIPELATGKVSNKVFHGDVNTLVADNTCDILYLDPPYNEREYGVYYHVLETIALYDKPIIKNIKTGYRTSVNKSKYTRKATAMPELKKLLDMSSSRYVVMSYSSEGIMSKNEIDDVLKDRGTLTVHEMGHKRFKCNNTDTDVKEVTEYLFVLDRSEKHNELPSTSAEVQQHNMTYNIDCIQGMKLLPDKSINMILCDLPYGTTECKWDIQLDLVEMWKEYERVITDNGAIVLFGCQPFTSKLVVSNLKLYKYALVWKKTKKGNFAQAPYRFLNEHEDIVVFSKGGVAKNAKSRMTYNPQGTVEINKKMKGKTGSTEFRQGRTEQKDYVQTRTNYPTSIIECPNEGKPQHPTQKPIDLCKYLIETFTNENDVVLDSCMGTGTTVVSCILTNRKYVGYELDPKFFEIATKRIKETIQQFRPVPPDENDPVCQD